jgi:hypothetical protein
VYQRMLYHLYLARFFHHTRTCINKTRCEAVVLYLVYWHNLHSMGIFRFKSFYGTIMLYKADQIKSSDKYTDKHSLSSNKAWEWYNF